MALLFDLTGSDKGINVAVSTAFPLILLPDQLEARLDTVTHLSSWDRMVYIICNPVVRFLLGTVNSMAKDCWRGRPEIEQRDPSRRHR